MKCSFFFVWFWFYWYIFMDFVLSYCYLFFVLIDVRCWYLELLIDRMFVCWIKYLIGCVEVVLLGLEFLLLCLGFSWCCVKDFYEVNGYVCEWEIVIDYLFGDLLCFIILWFVFCIIGRGEVDLFIVFIMFIFVVLKCYVFDERFWVYL